MTPAVNTNTVSTLPMKLRSRYQLPVGSAWGPWGAPSDWSGGVVALTVDIRPASIKNAVRADGTRPPRAWNHRWASGATKARTIGFTQTTIPQLIEREVTGSLLTGGIYPSWMGAVQAMGGGFAAAIDSFPYGVEAAARTKFLSELSGNKADLGVALGELKQTLGLCGSLAKDTLNMLESLVKMGKSLPKKVLKEVLHFGTIQKNVGNSAKAKAKAVKVQKAILNKWLEYQFGVKPLVGDIHDAGQALSDAIFLDRVPLRFTIRKGHGVEEVSYSLKPGAVGFQQLLLQHRGRIVSRCHISATYDLPVGVGRAMNELGLANPASLAWELTQFSWLVDYLTTMGKWLESLTARTGVTFVEGSLTKVQKVLTMEARVLLNPLYPAYQSRSGNEAWVPVGLGSCGQMTRDVLTDVFPAVRPTVRNRLDATKVANVLSVLALRARLS